MIAVTPIDSLKIYQRLKAAKIEEKAAKEIASIFSEVIENNLATKQDLKELETRLELKIELSKSDTLKWLVGWTTGLFLAQTGILITAIKFFR